MKDYTSELNNIIRNVSYNDGIGQLEFEMIGFCSRLITEAKKEVITDLRKWLLEESTDDHIARVYKFIEKQLIGEL